MRKLGFAGILLSATPALAAHWNVDPVTSKLMFEGQQADEKFQGSFPKFTSTIDFDPVLPETCRMHIAVTMANLQVEGKDRMDALPGKEWFDVAKFPFAEFTADSCKKLAPQQFVASGKLTLHGVTKEVALPFTLKPEGQSVVASGEITLDRTAYGVGSGQFNNEEWVKKTVRVSYEIHASAK